MDTFGGSRTAGVRVGVSRVGGRLILLHRTATGPLCSARRTRVRCRRGRRTGVGRPSQAVAWAPSSARSARRATASAGSFAITAAIASVPNTLGGAPGCSSANCRRPAIRPAASLAVSASNCAAPSAAPSSISTTRRSALPRRARVRSKTASASRLRPSIWSLRPRASAIET